MSYIDELRERFVAAEQRFGQISDAGREYRERLMGLMSRIEEEIRCRRDVERQQAEEIERLSGENQQLSGENEQLRTMMMSLLTAVEAGDTDSLGNTLNDMDSKVAVLIGEGQGSAAHEAPAATDIATDAVVDTDDSGEAGSEEPFVAPSFPAGEMMSHRAGEAPFSGEDSDLDHGTDHALEDGGDPDVEAMDTAEAEAAEESGQDDAPVAAEDAPVEPEAGTGTEFQAAPAAESSDSPEPEQPVSESVIASEIADFYGADDQADDGIVPDYSNAVAGWEDFLEDDGTASAAATSEADDAQQAVAEVPADQVGEEAGDPEAGSIHDLMGRVKTEIEGDDQDLDDDDGKAAAG